MKNEKGEDTDGIRKFTIIFHPNGGILRPNNYEFKAE